MSYTSFHPCVSFAFCPRHCCGVETGRREVVYDSEHHGLVSKMLGRHTHACAPTCMHTHTHTPTGDPKPVRGCRSTPPHGRQSGNSRELGTRAGDRVRRGNCFYDSSMCQYNATLVISSPYASAGSPVGALAQCVWRPFISIKAIVFTMIHHLSTALSEPQQCLVSPPGVAFPPSQHDSRTMYRACIPTKPCIPHMHAPLCLQTSPCLRATHAWQAHTHAHWMHKRWHRKQKKHSKELRTWVLGCWVLPVLS